MSDETKGNGDIFAGISNDGAPAINGEAPYVVHATLKGTAKLLCHRWSCDAVEAKAKAPKGSEAKKTDDTESYVYRDEDGEIGIPGEYVRMCVVNAARWYRDPSSTGRKSAVDLMKAAIIPLTELASLGVDQWDFLDRRRVVVQRSAITRERPGFYEGWTASFTMQIILPEYIPPMLLHDMLSRGGRQVGIGDFRPTFGRFAVTHFDTEEA